MDDSSEEIFAVARQLPGGEREAYLKEACDDGEQYEKVKALLAEAAEADAFFAEGGKTPAPWPRPAPPQILSSLNPLIGDTSFSTAPKSDTR